jgi:hypothetical protein
MKRAYACLDDATPRTLDRIERRRVRARDSRIKKDLHNKLKLRVLAIGIPYAKLGIANIESMMHHQMSLQKLQEIEKALDARPQHYQGHIGR